MDRLLTFPGGQPLYLDDINFLDNIYRTGIEDILKSVAKDIDSIVWGCEINGNTISDGVIWYQNELFFFEGGQVIEQELYNFKITEQDTSPHIFADGNSHNVQRIRKAVIAGLTDYDGSLDTLPRFIDLIRTFQQSAAWREPNYNNVGYGIERPYCRPFHFRKTNNGYLEFDGGFYSDTDNGIAFTLPKGYRPSETKYIHTAYKDNMYGEVHDNITIIKIDTNGNVSLINPDGTTLATIEVVFSNQLISLN